MAQRKVIMDKDILIGLALIAFSLFSVAALVLWSRRRIEQIARKGYRSARETAKDLQNGG